MNADFQIAEYKTAVRPCPICGNGSVEVLHRQRFVLPAGHILPSQYDVVWCPKCGFAYADTAADQATYDRYYGAFSKYEDQETSTGGASLEWDLRRLRETAETLAGVVADRAARIVDIGCANGGLLGELKKLGFTNLLGIDPSPACVRNAQALHGVPAQVGSFRQMPGGLEKFDLIMLSHVLEHVADLRGTIRDLARLLSDRGMLYIEVPDASRYAAFLVAPFQDFNTEHINHFDLSSLGNLLQRAGFAVASSGQKEVDSSPGCPYPAVFAIFQKNGGDMQRRVDVSLREQLLRYIDASQVKIDAINRKLERFSESGEPLIVWGTGQLTLKLLAETSLAKARITAFVDGNKVNQGTELCGVRVLAPNELSDRGTPILISTLVHQEEITKTIRDSLRLPNPVITL